MQQQQPLTDEFEDLFNIELPTVDLLQSVDLQPQSQQQHQQQPQAPHFPDYSDSSFAVSLSPLSSCSSGFSPHSSGCQHQHHHHQHHQQQLQQQPMPLFLEEQSDFLLPSDEATSPQLLAQPRAAQTGSASYPSTVFKLEPTVYLSEDGVSIASGAAAAGATASSPSHSASTAKSASRQLGGRPDKICGVCGDKALGFNFDAVSCESCKAFFRRNAIKGVEAFKCPYSGACSIDVSNRRFCKRCRLAKCFDIGMKREYILTEEEKSEKRKKIEQNKLIRTLESLQLIPKDLSQADLADRELLTEVELNDVKFLLEAYSSSEVVKVPERQGQRAVSFDDLINFAELSVVRVIDFCKKLPEFLRLSQPDRVALMKGGAVELILLRGVISFDPDTARFLDSGDVESAEQDSMDGGDFLKAAGSSGYAFLQLARYLRCNLQCDRASLILLLVVCLFSADRPGLTPEGRDAVEEAQIRFSLLLDRLLKTRLCGQEARKIYPQLLTQLAELRNLEKDFSDLTALTDPRVIRPLMAELLDMQEGQDSKKHRERLD